MKKFKLLLIITLISMLTMACKEDDPKDEDKDSDGPVDTGTPEDSGVEDSDEEPDSSTEDSDVALPNPPSDVFPSPGGYFLNGKGWMGYSWASAKFDSVIEPNSETGVGFSEAYAGEAVCVKGKVVSNFDGVTPLYNAVAILGINIGQPAEKTDTDQADGEDNIAAKPTGDGLYLKMDIREIGKFKICIGPNANVAADPDYTKKDIGYCAGGINPDNFVAGHVIPWTDFALFDWNSEECTDPTDVTETCKVTYNMEPINQVMITHEDNAKTADEAFDFCVIDMYDNGGVVDTEEPVDTDTTDTDTTDTDTGTDTVTL